MWEETRVPIENPLEHKENTNFAQTAPVINDQMQVSGAVRQKLHELRYCAAQPDVLTYLFAMKIFERAVLFYRMYTLLSGLWKYMFQKDEYCILILGLDNAGKTVR